MGASLRTSVHKRNRAINGVRKAWLAVKRSFPLEVESVHSRNGRRCEFDTDNRNRTVRNVIGTHNKIEKTSITGSRGGRSTFCRPQNQNKIHRYRRPIFLGVFRKFTLLFVIVIVIFDKPQTIIIAGFSFKLIGLSTRTTVRTDEFDRSRHVRPAW